MKKYKLKKKYLIPIIVLTSLITFFIIFGTSYAFFTASVTSNDFVITTGNLKLNYTKTGNVVNLSNTYPLTNTQGLATTGYTFNITNNGSIDTKYQIRLEIDSNNTIPLEYVKMAYVKTKENNTDTNNSISEPILLSNLDATNTFIKNQLINPTKTDSYTLKFWIDFSAPNDIQGKTFKATIVIDSIQDVEDGYAMAGTRPIITLNKYSDGNIDRHILVNEQFTDPGVLSVKDDKDLLTEEDVNITYDYTSDGTNLSQVSGIDTTTPGIYYINYEVTDSDNLTASITRVVVINNIPSIPTIALIGSHTITIEQYSTFTDPGVTVESNNKVAVIGEVKTIAPGTYTVRYIVIDSNGSVNSVTRNVIVNEKTVWEFAFDPDGDGEGQVQTFEVPHDGTYKLEAWGGQGGHYKTTDGGEGGYATGTIYLEANTVLTVIIGGKGQGISQSGWYTNQNLGGYNGGGAGGPDGDGNDNGQQEAGGGGGGYTIIKNNNVSYLCAGGGGGAGGYGAISGSGGAGSAGGGGGSGPYSNNNGEVGIGKENCGNTVIGGNGGKKSTAPTGGTGWVDTTLLSNVSTSGSINTGNGSVKIKYISE